MPGKGGLPLRFALLLSCLVPALAGATDELGPGEPGWDLPMPGWTAATPPRNSAQLSQAGNDNAASLYQDGSGQVAVIRQWGEQNRASVLQEGSDQRVLVDQVGTGNQAQVIQHGQSQTVRVQQWGDYQNARVVQTD